MATMWEKSLEAATVIKSKLPFQEAAAVWIVLGSGLGKFADNIDKDAPSAVIPYEQIPHFPKPTVAGHAGKLVAGSIKGVKVIIQQGRWHLYEGHHAGDVIIGIRCMHHLNVKTLLVTNAAGGINQSTKPGKVMLMTDHINLMSDNPLIGGNEDRFGARFPDMTHAYTPELLQKAREAAKEVGVEIAEGVYCALRGPTYETPAEIRFLRTIGADAVGMSTVPEVIAASHQKARVVGFSCITNMAAGILDQPLNHEEVQQVADMAAADFTKLLIRLIQKL